MRNMAYVKYAGSFSLFIVLFRFLWLWQNYLTKRNLRVEGLLWAHVFTKANILHGWEDKAAEGWGSRLLCLDSQETEMTGTRDRMWNIRVSSSDWLPPASLHLHNHPKHPESDIWLCRIFHTSTTAVTRIKLRKSFFVDYRIDTQGDWEQTLGRAEVVKSKPTLFSFSHNQLTPLVCRILSLFLQAT